MKAYISISYSNRQDLRNAVTTITGVLTALQITAWVFADQYQFNADDEKLMMQQALLDIEQCDFLIAETSYKAIGVGVEAGYAKAKGKPVIYMRQVQAPHSTTVSGISDHTIIYRDLADLHEQLFALVSNMCNASLH